MERVVEVLVQIATSKFDRPLSYRVPDGPTLRVGDVVRVPLGNRDVFGFVISAEHPSTAGMKLRDITERAGVERAFDEEGLDLARFVAQSTVCTLRDALSAIVLSAALPRVVERVVPQGARPATERFADVPERLIALLWSDFPDGVSVASLLRHPEARRAGDRRKLLAAVGSLIRARALLRVRSIERPSMMRRTIRVLVPGLGTIRGRSVERLVHAVADAGEMLRADAVLAGFSDAVIRRALAADAIREIVRPLDRQRTHAVRLPDLTPTAEQAVAIAAIGTAVEANTFGQFLLHGITGSGKTLVYLHAIARVLARGGKAILLVPEIALTPQTAARFTSAFGDRVAVLHSALSERARFDAWQAAARGEIDVVVGARSAIFVPLPDVRIVVIDEEHEASYRQDTIPRYHAVEVARERMRRAGGVLVLGSATPSLETYARAKAGRYALLELHARATAQALPTVEIIDMAQAFVAGTRRALSTRVVSALGERLACGEKSVLFLNRRGAARFLLCRSCGHVPACERCSTSLVVHREEGLLRCHYCDAQHAIPQTCQVCGDGPIAPLGFGTQRLVDELAELFPSARIVRMDADTTTRIGDHARLLAEFEHDGDMLVGTQMVIKGLDFPDVTLAVAVAADADLHLADYRAAERTFDAVVQLCGRSGRGKPGEALVQTYAPQHPAIVYAANHEYAEFARAELAERRALGWPPFSRLVFLGTIGRDRTSVIRAIDRYADALRADGRWEVLGPAPFPLERLNDEWRHRIAIKTRYLDQLRTVLRDEIVPMAARDTTNRLVIAIDG
jgi:primosomal protein N' (replication factor Y) (superfamily II helicase)